MVRRVLPALTCQEISDPVSHCLVADFDHQDRDHTDVSMRN